MVDGLMEAVTTLESVLARLSAVEGGFTAGTAAVESMSPTAMGGDRSEVDGGNTEAVTELMGPAAVASAALTEGAGGNEMASQFAFASEHIFSTCFATFPHSSYQECPERTYFGQI